jgi:alanine-glyoxylate transaminase/(R)-3-amino-2-methylpropionate-pyruvate transaminase
LASLLKEFPLVVGDVRGKGLMIGIELVHDPETKESLPADDIAQIFEDVKDMGVLFGIGGVKGNVSYNKYLIKHQIIIPPFSSLLNSY